MLLLQFFITLFLLMLMWTAIFYFELHLEGEEDE